MLKVLLYCCKAKPYLYKTHFVKVEDVVKGINDKFIYEVDNHERTYLNGEQRPFLNGKIVAECDFEVEEIKLLEDSNATMITNTLSEEELLKKSCLEGYELCNYLYDNLWCGQKGYAIHIKNLHIFDEPKELSDFNKIIETTYGEEPDETITKAPQNMMRCCYEKKPKEWEIEVLISIKPEELCRILNGEQTILINKKVLKCMKGKM